MTKGFGATSTTDDVLAGVDLSGKRVLITGVSAGLGVETARALAAHGAQVVGAARDLAKAERATNEVRTQAANGGGTRLSNQFLQLSQHLILGVVVAKHVAGNGHCNNQDGCNRKERVKRQRGS